MTVTVSDEATTVAILAKVFVRRQATHKVGSIIVQDPAQVYRSSGRREMKNVRIVYTDPYVRVDTAT